MKNSSHCTDASQESKIDVPNELKKRRHSGVTEKKSRVSEPRKFTNPIPFDEVERRLPLNIRIQCLSTLPMNPVSSKKSSLLFLRGITLAWQHVMMFLLSFILWGMSRLSSQSFRCISVLSNRISIFSSFTFFWAIIDVSAMKEFRIERTFAFPFAEFVNNFVQEKSFQMTYQSSRGDSDIVIDDWSVFGASPPTQATAQFPGI